MWKKLLYGLAGLVGIGIGASNLYDLFVLPGCDSSRITDTVRGIFSDREVPLTLLDRIETTAEGDTISCKAYIETADEIADITYTISRDGMSTQVRIDTVEAQPIANPPAGAP